MATRAPWAMKACAHARPIPLLPPVISTFLLFSPRSMSVRRDAFRLDDPGQALRLLRDEGAGLLRRGDEGVERLALELLDQLLRLEHRAQRRVEPRDDGGRRLGGRDARPPL